MPNGNSKPWCALGPGQTSISRRRGCCSIWPSMRPTFPTRQRRTCDPLRPRPSPPRTWCAISRGCQVSPDRAAFHIERAWRLTAALDEIAALESLLPPHKTPTLLVSLRVLRHELELATAALTCKEVRRAR